MMKHWVETRGVIQRKHSDPMKMQETRTERIVQTPRGLRLNPEYLRQLAVEHREALTILGKNDGSVIEAENAGPR